MILGLPACADRNKPAPSGDPQLQAYLELVTPAKIQIQRYLTKPVSLAADGSADGLEVILAAYDAGGDLTKAAGKFQFELTTRKVGDTIGTRVGFWPVDIDTEKSLREYRDKLSRYYEFPLALPNKPLPPGEYVVSVWLHLPEGKRLFDEYEFSYDGKGAPPVRGL